MRRLKAVFAIVCIISFAGSNAFAEVHFKSVSFAEAQKLAKKSKKKIMVDFYTDWCKWCKVLDRETYSDNAVGTFADQKFVSVKIDAEKGEGITLAKKYDVHGYPTVMFFSAEGKEIDRVVGYKEAEGFKRAMKVVDMGGTKAIIEKTKAKGGCKDPSMWLTAANYYAEQSDRKNALNAYEQAINLDMNDSAKVREEAVYAKAFMLEGPAMYASLDEALHMFPNRPEASQAFSTLIKHDLEANPDIAVTRAREYQQHHPQDGDAFNAFAWAAAEKGVVLDQAAEFAELAVGTMREPADRAAALDTKAEILFKQGRIDQAVAVEDEAVHMLDPVKNKKLLTELQASLDRYRAALSNNEQAPADGVAITK